MNFYNKYLALCNQLRKTPSRVAESNGISRASVNRWKNGSTPSDAILLKLADYFGVSIEYLKGTEQKEKPTDNKADEPMYELYNKYISLSAQDKKTIDDMFDFLLSKPEYTKKHNAG